MTVLDGERTLYFMKKTAFLIGFFRKFSIRNRLFIISVITIRRKNLDYRLTKKWVIFDYWWVIICARMIHLVAYSWGRTETITRFVILGSKTFLSFSNHESFVWRGKCHRYRPVSISYIVHFWPSVSWV